ncbi:Ctr copper transporter [Aspergillus recurvatus]
MDTDMGNHGYHDHATNTDGDAMAMMTMPAVFTTSTTITLFFSSWKTSSSFTYILTLLFLFALAFLNRFLAALRFQLEYAHSRSTESSILILAPPRPRQRGVGLQIPKARLSPLPMYMRVESDKDCEEVVSEGTFLRPCSSISRDPEEAPFGTGSTERSPLWTRIRRGLRPILPSWAPSAPWSLRQDGSRAALEGVRAFTGYILMLAVMTFNVGIFLVVLGGIVFGELVLGRYMRHSAWEDGACHD